jgi:hypothetical protein
MKKLIYTCVVLFLITGTFAQKPDASVVHLKKGDVERFIKHFRSIEGDFEKIDLKYTPDSNPESFTEAIDNIDEVNSILKKYGYKDVDDFATKTWVITISYANIKMNTEGSGEFADAIEEIKNSTELTKEQKEAAIERLKQAMGAVESSFSSMVNEKDVETVRPFLTQLDEILDKN